MMIKVCKRKLDVHLLCLLEQDIVEHPCNINIYVVLNSLQYVHVGFDGCKQLAWFSNLAGLWAVHDHARQSSGKPGLQVLVKVLAGSKRVFPDTGKNIYEYDKYIKNG